MPARVRTSSRVSAPSETHHALPILEHTAFLLLSFVGCILIIELTWPEIHVSALQKFVGILIIVVLTLIYDPRAPQPHNMATGLQTALNPVFKVAYWPMKIYSLITGTILGLIFKPFRAIVGLFQKKSAETPV